MLYRERFREYLALEGCVLLYDRVTRSGFRNSLLTAHEFVTRKLGVEPEVFAGRVRMALKEILTGEEYALTCEYFGIEGDELKILRMESEPNCFVDRKREKPREACSNLVWKISQSGALEKYKLQRNVYDKMPDRVGIREESIETLGLPVTVFKVLIGHNVQTVGELMAIVEAGMLGTFRWIGPKLTWATIETLCQHGCVEPEKAEVLARKNCR